MTVGLPPLLYNALTIRTVGIDDLPHLLHTIHAAHAEYAGRANTAFYTHLGYHIAGVGAHPGFTEPTYMTVIKVLGQGA
jgi:hypothetical protein